MKMLVGFFQENRWILKMILILVMAVVLGLSRVPSVKGAPYAARIYVDADASGADDGTSWGDAYVHLQDALDQTNADGGSKYEIWVAEGVYYPDEDSDGDHTDNDQLEYFEILYDNVHLFGGFSGSETSRDERNWIANPTILSGDIDGNDTNTDGDFIADDWNDIMGNNAYHVVLLNGAANEDITLDTIIDGFTITAGGNLSQYAGGVYCFAASSSPPYGVCSPTLRNLNIQGNRAMLGGGLGLYTDYAGLSSPYLTEVSFIKNYAAQKGGGVWINVANDPAGESQAVLVNVKFRGNHAEDDGGGLYSIASDGTCNHTLTNVEFYDNDAGGHGGGVYMMASTDGTSQTSLTNVSFHDNHAVGKGGALYNYRYELSGTFGMNLSNAILWGNTADSSRPEIFNYNALPVITHSDIQGSGGSGGGWVTSFGIDNGGNIDEDPQFANPGAGDLSLQETSPAIDAGDMTLLPADVTDLDQDGNVAEMVPLDLAWNSRVKCGEVDMGAYEFLFCQGVLADFDGDGDTDISVFRPSNGNWYVKGMSPVSWALAGDLPEPADYDGDGTTDIAVYRPSNGNWYVKDQGKTSWGFTGDIPVPADYDGDGADEIAVLRPSNHKWYIQGMGNVSWHQTGDIPVPCDYDGDGADEIAVMRPSNGKWYIQGMGNFFWYQSGDIPVPADYDGDGTCDIAVYRPSNGNWYVRGQEYTNWGFPDDIPVPGDYDGDGAAEIAVLRPSNGKWYIQGMGNFYWYYTGDYPLPVRDTNADGDPYQ